MNFHRSLDLLVNSAFAGAFPVAAVLSATTSLPQWMILVFSMIGGATVFGFMGWRILRERTRQKPGGE